MRRQTTAMITIAICGDTHAHVVKATDSNGKPVSKIMLIAHKHIYTLYRLILVLAVYRTFFT